MYILNNGGQKICISCLGGRRQGSSALCSSRRSDCAMNQNPSFRSKKFPCFRTGCLELTAWGHLNSGTGTFQIYVENHRRSHRTSCTGPDPTNFWESNMWPAQNCEVLILFTTAWTLPSFQPHGAPVENTFILPSICLAALTALLWLG